MNDVGSSLKMIYGLEFKDQNIQKLFNRLDEFNTGQIRRIDIERFAETRMPKIWFDKIEKYFALKNSFFIENDKNLKGYFTLWDIYR